MPENAVVAEGASAPGVAEAPSVTSPVAASYDAKNVPASVPGSEIAWGDCVTSSIRARAANGNSTNGAPLLLSSTAPAELVPSASSPIPKPMPSMPVGLLANVRSKSIASEKLEDGSNAHPLVDVAKVWPLTL